MRKYKLHYIFIIIIIISIVSMSNSFAYFDTLAENNNVTLTSGSWDYGKSISTYFTGFEDATKTAYTAGDIITYGRSWRFSSALIGTLATDKKNDAKSARIRAGYIETNFYTTNIRTLSFYAGTFGTDIGGAFNIMLSSNKSTWSLYTTFNVTTSFNYYHIYFDESVLANLSLSRDDNLYIRISYANGTNRMNIDDVEIKNTYDPNVEMEFSEKFETATKSNYTTAVISINGLNWLFTDSVIGTATQDRKIGSKAARIRNGSIATEFKIMNISEISFYYARYGNDAAANIFVEVSSNKTNWYSISGTLSPTTSLKKVTIVVNNSLLAPNLVTTDALYIRIRSNDSNRFNVDDLMVKYTGEASIIR